MSEPNYIVELLREIARLGGLSTDMPVQKNDNPDYQELMYRLAVHVLQDACGNNVCLLQAPEVSVYLIPCIMGEDSDTTEDAESPRPEGYIEYMVCDGLPGDWSHGETFYDLKSAVKRYNDVVIAGGFTNLERQAKVGADEMFGYIDHLVNDQGKIGPRLDEILITDGPKLSTAFPESLKTQNIPWPPVFFCDPKEITKVLQASAGDQWEHIQVFTPRS